MQVNQTFDHEILGTSPVGTLLQNRYKILSPVGLIGRGLIYKATDVLEERAVAISVILPKVSDNAVRLEKFQVDADRVRQLDHPNIYSTSDFGFTADGHLYLVMDYLEASRIFSSINMTQHVALPVSIERALGITVQVAEGFAAAHKVGIIHRCLTRDCLVLVPDDSGYNIVKIVEFGIARLFSIDESSHQLINPLHSLHFHAFFFSPEMVYAGKSIDSRTDVFSLGAVMFAMITEKLPAESRKPADYLWNQRHFMHRVLAETVKDRRLSEELESMIFRATAIVPKDRYSSMEHFIKKLRHVRTWVVNRSRARKKRLWTFAALSSS